MPWFRVDDGFHSHPKRLAVSLAAVGLWTVAGSWSSAHLTDGFVPDNLLLLLSPDAPELARELVAAGLWKRRKGGHQFHDWAARNPSKESVENARKGNAERQRRLRDSRRDHPETIPRPELNTDFAGTLPSGTRENSAGTGLKTEGAKHETAGQEAKRNAVTNAGSHGATNRTPVPDPDPDPKDQKKDPPPPPSASAPPRGRKRPAAAIRLPEDFAVTAEMVAWARASAPNVDGRRETERFTDHWRSAGGANARKRDWAAAWRNWMRRAEDDLSARPQPRQSRTQEVAGIFDNQYEMAARIEEWEAANDDANGNGQASRVRPRALPASGD